MTNKENYKEKYQVKIKPGDKMRFLGEGGYPFQLERALRHLTPGEIYTVSNVYVDEWGVYLYFEGIPNKSFPEDMFEKV